MRKILFIMMFAIAGCFGMASAQVEQTTPQNSGTINQNLGTTPNSNSTTTPQGTYGNQDTSRTTTNGNYEKQQGTMNKSHDKMNKALGTMNDTHGAMSQNEKGWTKIGEKTLNLSKDREEIVVSGAEKFSSIKIKVPEDAMVDLKNVVVEYEGGTKQNVDMSSAVNSASDESKIIELNSTDRNVKKISFAYEPRESKNSMSMSNNGSTSGTKGKNSSSMGTSLSSMGTSSSSKDTSSNSMGNSSGTNGTMGSKSTKKGSMSISERGTKGSKAKIEVWGLRSDTALK